MSPIKPLFPLLLLMPLAGCGILGPDDREVEPIEGLPRQLTVGEREVIQAGNAFTFDLLREVVEEEGTKNVFISPLSASYALGMTLNGADGETFRAMRETLHLKGLGLDEINGSYASLTDLLVGLDPAVEMTIANSLWPKQGFAFKQSFLTRVRDSFDAHVQPLDFRDPASVDVINDWVSEETNGRIPELIQVIPREAVLYLINAIYFKAPWKYQFDPDRTRNARFMLPDGSHTEVPMMIRDGPVRTFSTEHFTAADLRYGGGAYSMTILLPHPNVTVAALVNSLNAEGWADWMDRFEERDFAVHLPRFRMEYEIELKNVLASLGMGVAFTDHADFTRMSEAAELLITSVLQKTFLLVNEEGTEAAAATSVEIGVVSAPPVISIDRPFLLAIRERFSGTILFIGQVMNPAET